MTPSKTRPAGGRAKLAFAFAAAVIAAPDLAAAEFTLTILHTNDFHSRIEPINKFDSACNAESEAKGECFGGSARLATAVAARRAALAAEGRPSLLVDGGDQFQGSLFYTTYKGKAAAEMMNRLGYDGMTVGNHEFDDGPEVLRGFLDAVAFPVLLANADVSAEPALAGVLQPWRIVETGGERIGLVGVAPADTPDLASPGPNVRFRKPEPALNEAVAQLRAEGVDKIVLLSHSGLLADRYIAATVPGIDVIVGGHSNTFLSNLVEGASGPYPTWVDGPEGARVPIVQAYAYGKYLGELTVKFDDAGRVTEAVGEPIAIDAAFAPDPAVAQRIAELAAPLDAIRNQVVAETTAPIDGDRAQCRAQVCEMGVLVAEAMLARAADQGIEIAIQNGGGLRASIDAGPVTLGEVLTVLPFQNTLATFRLSGAGVLAALENGFSKAEEGAGRFPQVAGVKVVWNPAAAAGARVVSVEVADGAGGFAPLDPARLYGVVSNNFMRSGGDGYAVFSTDSQDAYDFGPNLEDVVVGYLQENAPYTPRLDQRIRAVE